MWVFVRVEWEVIKRGITGAGQGTTREIVDPDEREGGAEGYEYELEEEMEMERERTGHGRERESGRAQGSGGVGSGIGGYGTEGPFDVVFEAGGEGQGNGKVREV